MPAASVAEQVRVCPVVSELIVVEPHPVSEVIVIGAVTVHVTVTSLVYQPLLPSVPEIFGVTVGGTQTFCTALPVSFPLLVKVAPHSLFMVAGLLINPVELLVIVLKLFIVPELFFIVPEFVIVPLFVI